MSEHTCKKIRWGILGAGGIIDRWIRGARQLDDEMEIVGIASRTRESAEKAAAKYNIPGAFTYEELLSRDDIDVFYVATPHTAHKELTMRALKKKKAVLVEKPAGINAAEFEEMVSCARENQTFLMEAIWTAFFPAVRQIRECIESGVIGEVKMIESAFSFQSSPDKSPRLFDPEKAGGGLLDVGVYNLHFSQMILNKEPVALTGLASFSSSNPHRKVDEQAAWIAQYDDGALSIMSCGIKADMIDTAYIYGTKGRIVVPIFWKPSGFQLVTASSAEDIDLPIPQKEPEIEDEGYQFEIAHVNDCLRKGIKESPVASFDVTVSVLRQCDELRRQWGFSYPSEQDKQ